TSGAWLLGDARADTARRTDAQYAAAPDVLKTMGAGTLSADAGEAGRCCTPSAAEDEDVERDETRTAITAAAIAAAATASARASVLPGLHVLPSITPCTSASSS